MKRIMLPVVMTTISQMTRICRNCHHSQIVPQSQKSKNVVCKFCGETIQPKKKK